jgi:hypothetical protein
MRCMLLTSVMAEGGATRDELPILATQVQESQSVLQTSRYRLYMFYISHSWIVLKPVQNFLNNQTRNEHQIQDT